MAFFRVVGFVFWFFLPNLVLFSEVAFPLKITIFCLNYLFLR